MNKDFIDSPQTPMYTVSLDYSSDDNCSSAGSSYTSAGERKETDTLKKLRQKAERQQAKLTRKSEEKKIRMEQNIPDFIPQAKGDLGVFNEDEEDQARAEE